jgi:hypothetical protein
MKDDTEITPKAIHMYEESTSDINPAELRTRYITYTEVTGE